MPYVGASVDEATKEKWESYVEDSDYGSLSELIRSTVRQEIRSEGAGAAGASRETTVEVDRLQEQQQTTIQRIEALQEAVEQAQEERETTEYPEEVVDVAHQIAGDLDTISSDEYARMTSDADTGHVKLADEYFGDRDDTPKVVAAFNYLEENIPWIRKRPTPPSEYYRVED